MRFQEQQEPDRILTGDLWRWDTLLALLAWAAPKEEGL